MYAVLDIESTGGKYNEEGITEIAIHKFDGHRVVDKFVSLVNPEREIQPFVANLTGINNKMLRTAPKFHEVAKRIVKITEGTVLVAHNAQFDYRILRTEFRRLGYNFERKTLCTVDLAKKLIPDAESHSLGKLVRSLGIPVSDRHRANGDAMATLKLFKVLLAKDVDKSILKDVVRGESLGELSPRQLDMVAQMPSEIGIYYMHNKDSEIIFLGKSGNIKKSVNTHFIKSGPQARHIQKETKKVTFEKTGSELVALLKEYEEQHRNKPKYGYPNGKFHFKYALYQETDPNGYIALRIAPYNSGQHQVCTFINHQGAEKFLDKITQEYGLCPVLNGLDPSTSPCALKMNSGCLGPCGDGQIQPIYNGKVHEISRKYSLKDRSLVIVDKGRETGEYSAILIVNGVLKGLGYYDLNHQINNIHILESIITPMRGDHNTTHIIESYLRRKSVLKVLDLNS